MSTASASLRAPASLHAPTCRGASRGLATAGAWWGQRWLQPGTGTGTGTGMGTGRVPTAGRRDGEGERCGTSLPSPFPAQPSPGHGCVQPVPETGPRGPWGPGQGVPVLPPGAPPREKTRNRSCGSPPKRGHEARATGGSAHRVPGGTPWLQSIPEHPLSGQDGLSDQCWGCGGSWGVPPWGDGGERPVRGSGLC